MEKKYYSWMFSDASYAGSGESNVLGLIKTFW